MSQVINLLRCKTFAIAEFFERLNFYAVTRAILFFDVQNISKMIHGKINDNKNIFAVSLEASNRKATV